MSKKPDPQFARHRNATEIIELARQHGHRVNAERFGRGDDHLTIEMPGPAGTPVPVLYNVFSGRFFHYSRVGGLHFASDSDAHEGEPWFDAMLEFFYAPKETV